MKLRSYRDSRSPVKGRASNRAILIQNPAFYLALTGSLMLLQACAVDPPLQQELEGTWLLADGGFSCSSDGTAEGMSAASGVYDDISLEISGTEGRLIRTLGSCEETFLFDVDASRADEIQLRASASVECSGCDEEDPPEDCGTTPEKPWSFKTTLVTTEAQEDEITGEEIPAQTSLTLVSGLTESDRGFGKVCTAQVMEAAIEEDLNEDDTITEDEITPAVMFQNPAQILLIKN